MIRKHNIATPLLLLVWVAMLCFFIVGRLSYQVPATAPVHAFAAAFLDNEELSPENQDQPTAWAEQSAPTVAASASDSPLPLYTSVSWITMPVQLYRNLKPGKVLCSKACTAIRFRILPNAP